MKTKKSLGTFAVKAVFIAVLLAAAAACRKYDGDTTPPGFRPVTPGSSKWISEVVEYRPAPGQFINDAGWGTPERAQSIVGGGGGKISLGGFGGWIVFKFDHTVPNVEGFDFVIKGNAYEGSSEPGAVAVSFDANGNGLPDDPWHELSGEDHGLTGTLKDYEVTYFAPSQTETSEEILWEDGGGGSGSIPEMSWFGHPQSYWPSFAAGAGSLVFKGTRLSDPVEYDVVREEYVLRAAGRGYADNFSSDYTEIVGGDPDTQFSNKFDISSAGAGLQGVDFIKVYTCVNSSAGPLGEVSTEVMGAISLAVPRR